VKFSCARPKRRGQFLRTVGFGAVSEEFFWPSERITMQGKTKLNVVENITKGFFDPIALASELEIALAEDDNIKTTAKERMVKAISLRVGRARKKAIASFLKDEKREINESQLLRRNTKNHPLCMHACLLGRMMRALYPHGSVYVHNEDARWLLLRAPELSVCAANDMEGGTENDSNGGGGDLGNLDGEGDGEAVADGDEGPSTSRRPTFEDGSISAKKLGGSGGQSSEQQDGNESLNSLCPRLDGGKNEKNESNNWWSEVIASVECRDFTNVSPPWSAHAKQRLVTCDLPHSIKLTIDPETGLVRATDIANAFDKRLKNWLFNGLKSNDDEGTRGLAYALAKDVGTTPDKLVYVVNGGGAGTWVHIQMIVDLASWCSKPFALHVSKLVMRFHSGELTTEESLEARSALDAATSQADCGGVVQVPERVPTKSPAHRLVRAVARNSSVRAPDTVRDVPIPRHLVNATGAYAGVWGIVTDETGPWYHFKVGIAPDQPVRTRVRSHYGERPHTFVLLFIAGCDDGMCRVVEACMKHLLGHILALPTVGNSDEEFKVPADQLDDVLARLVDELKRRHRDVVTLSEDVPVSGDLEKHRITCECECEREVKKYAFDQILKMSDEHARERAIAAMLGPRH
jgi:hypothetical protein